MITIVWYIFWGTFMESHGITIGIRQVSIAWVAWKLQGAATTATTVRRAQAMGPVPGRKRCKFQGLSAFKPVGPGRCWFWWFWWFWFCVLRRHRYQLLVRLAGIPAPRCLSQELFLSYPSCRRCLAKAKVLQWHHRNDWYMIGIWLVCDWYIIIWLVYEWYMNGIWLVYEWYMNGIWLVYDWYMVEKDGGRFFYRTFHLLEMILGQGSALSCWWPLSGRHHQTAGMRSWPLLSIWRRGYVPTGGTGPSNH